MKKYKYKYLCERESEQKFRKVLKENNLLISAKIEVFNISNKDIKSIIRKCARGDFWIFIVDIDVFNSDLFCKNIKLLHKNRCKFCIIFQNKNLEDEIIRCCDVSNEIDLFRKFYTVTSATEFKNRLIKDNSLYSKLKRYNFNIDLLWSFSKKLGYCNREYQICKNIKRIKSE